MLTPITFPSVYARLSLCARRGLVQRHAAYLAAGFLTVLGVKPPLPNVQPFRASTLFIAFFVLIGGLMLFSGAILTLVQPLLIAIGGLTLERAMVGTVLLIFVWRYFVGRKLLNAFMAYQGVSGEAAIAGVTAENQQ